MKSLWINTRIVEPKMVTSFGIRRYFLKVMEYIALSEVPHRTVHPEKSLNVLQGHLWEQFVLTNKIKDHGFLWSPAQSGPIHYANQVVTIHDVMPIDYLDLNFVGIKGYPYYKSLWFKWMWKRLFHKVKAIISVSHYTKQRIMDLFDVPEDKIMVIYEAADEQFRPVSDEQVEQVKAKYKIKWKKYLVSLGAVEPKRNFKTAVRAWEKLPPVLTADMGLAVVGQPRSYIPLQKLGLDSLPENVAFTGFVADGDLPALFCGASAFVFPSLYEGFGIPPLEAMACGTPVVASNVTAIPEVCGDAALYANPLDAEDFAEKIQAVLESPSLAEEMRAKGLARAAQFSWEKCAKEHIEFFQKFSV